MRTRRDSCYLSPVEGNSGGFTSGVSHTHRPGGFDAAQPTGLARHLPEHPRPRHDSCWLSPVEGVSGGFTSGVSHPKALENEALALTLAQRERGCGGG